MSLEHLTDERIENLVTVLKAHHGNSRLKIKVMYAQQALEVKLLPKKVNVALSKPLLSALSTLGYVELSLN
jgi:hypothetical protein